MNSRRQVRVPFWAIFFISLLILFGKRQVGTANAHPSYQDTAVPTQTKVVPTVTGTPLGPYVIVNSDNDQINVRECPNTTTCAIVGYLLPGQKITANGRTDGGMWIQIDYPGVPGGVAWVHSSLVSLYGGSLPVVEPPATPTPLVTSTIDPTLAAQFVITIQPSRLPTFTNAAPIEITTYEPVETSSAPGNIPVGMIILSLAALGIFGALLSVLRGR